MHIRCPHCRSSQHWRWTRPAWMWFTPGPMDNHRCSACGREYTIWFGVFSQRQSFSRSFCRVWHWSLLVLFFAALAFVIPLFV